MIRDVQLSSALAWRVAHEVGGALGYLLCTSSLFLDVPHSHDQSFTLFRCQTQNIRLVALCNLIIDGRVESVAILNTIKLAEFIANLCSKKGGHGQSSAERGSSALAVFFLF